MTQIVNITTEGPVGIIELNRPDHFNCLSTQVFAAIDAGLDRFEADSSIRAILLCAAGQHFCTGADLDQVTGARDNLESLQAFIDPGLKVLDRFEASDLPVVAAVHGLCLAGGTEIMLACDIVFAARSAQFGDQHAQFGLVAGWGGTQRFPRVVGPRRALDLFFSGKWIEAAEAEQWGLVNYVCDDDALRDEALAYCTKLATRSRSGLAMMKQLARQGIQGTLADGLTLERQHAVPHLMSEDVDEGLSAFKQRRTPKFK